MYTGDRFGRVFKRSQDAAGWLFCLYVQILSIKLLFLLSHSKHAGPYQGRHTKLVTVALGSP